MGNPGNPLRRPIRVCHVITGLHTGGAETALVNLIRALPSEAIESSIVTLVGEGPLGADVRALGISVTDIGMVTALDGARAVPTLRRVISRLRPDIVQGWMYHGNIAALLATAFRRSRMRCYWNIRHSLEALASETPSTRRLIRASAHMAGFADHIVYNGLASARQHQEFGFPIDRSSVVHNGFDTRRFRRDPAARSLVRRSLGVADDRVVISLVGRYHPVKGHDLFLRAAAHLSRDRSDVEFLLVGRGTDTNNAVLLQQVRQTGAVVHLLGERRDMPAVLAASDIVTSASITEGFPNAVGEAMATSIPCVVTDVGDSAYLVGDSGIVVRPNDPDALCAAWMQLLGEGWEGRKARGVRAQSRIALEFSNDEVVRRYEELYLGGVSGGAPAARE